MTAVNAEGFQLGIGDVENELDAARLLADLLAAADGELAAGGQWGRAEVGQVDYSNGQARFATVLTHRSFDNDLQPVRDAGKRRAFRVTVERI